MTRSVIVAVAVFAASISIVSAQNPPPDPAQAPAPAPAPAPAAAPDLAAGETSFKKCLPCHRIGEGAKNLVGPQLNGLDGRHSGTAPDYNYTDANKNSGIVWAEATFKEYITDPRTKIPGTKMVFAGIKNENERNNLWAYLKQFNADGTKKP
jgi:cytochrome c